MIKKITQETFDKIKSQPDKTQQQLADELGLSTSSISRVRRSATLSDLKYKDRYQPSIVRRTENRKSIITTVIKNGKAKITITPKKSLWEKIISKLFKDQK